VLPAGATVAGRDSHPLETTRLSRRTEKCGKREPGKLLSRWNLVVPERILNRGWSEVT